MPVPNQSGGEQQKGDRQQAGSFPGINRMPLMLVAGIALALRVHHDFIVRRSETVGAVYGCACQRRRALVLHYASLVVVYRESSHARF